MNIISKPTVTNMETVWNFDVVAKKFKVMQDL